VKSLVLPPPFPWFTRPVRQRNDLLRASRGTAWVAGGVTVSFRHRCRGLPGQYVSGTTSSELSELPGGQVELLVLPPPFPWFTRPVRQRNYILRASRGTAWVAGGVTVSHRPCCHSLPGQYVNGTTSSELPIGLVEFGPVRAAARTIATATKVASTPNNQWRAVDGRGAAWCAIASNSALSSRSRPHPWAPQTAL